MLRIAICDDDKILVTQIEEMLNRYLDKKMIDRYIEIFYDGASLEQIKVTMGWELVSLKKLR